MDITASITLVSAGEKLQGGTNQHTDTLTNSIVKPNVFIYKTYWYYVIFAHFSKQFMLPPLNVSTSALSVTIGM